ncbi:hypothetical protein C8R47DRAFT_1192937 [Mycena vitilis]|nr:hypothetical protein C8R47DRAFT_1192937 [Mycena vitilis]
MCARHIRFSWSTHHDNMPTSEAAWSQIPPEIAYEIAAHNADDVSSLRAMSLVSKTMRTFAIEHLFSVIHFACSHDMTWWHTMLLRTPKLQTIVKKVKFSDTGRDRTERGRVVRSRKKISGAVVPPKFSVMPNVRVVEWNADDFIAIRMAVAYLSLFPNLNELYLNNFDLDGFDELATLLAACGRLRLLTLCNIKADAFELDYGSEDEWLPRTPTDRKSTFDLIALEKLAIMNCGDPKDPDSDFLVRMVEHSQPTELKSLTFAFTESENFGREKPCSIRAMERLLCLANPSLVNLSLVPIGSDMPQVTEMLKRLPSFPALTMFSTSLTVDGGETQQIMNALQAPNLTTLDFRVVFSEDAYKYYEEFREIIRTWPWGKSESMKSAVTRKFPLIRRISFSFCAPHDARIHFRRGLRRKLERRLRDCLDETGADVAGYLQLRWLDDKYNPVLYSRINGKPKWKLPPHCQEPLTEASDCDTDAYLGFDYDWD